MKNRDLDRDFGEIAKEEEQGTKASEKKAPKGKRSVVSMVLCLIGIGMMLFAGWNLYTFFKDYADSNALYSGIEQEYVTKNTQEENTESTEEVEVPWYEMYTVDLEGVKDMNSDVIGWIDHETEEISSPILYSGDNTTYLRTGIDMKHATAGCIFMEGANSPDFQDSHTIIYGHNMRNLSMFGKLKYYHEEGYYEENQYFQIHTQNTIYRYQIFAYEVVEPDSFIYSVPYAPGTQFAEFLDKIYRKSEVDTGVVATDADKIITLSTCSSNDKRFVVCAVRVDSHARELSE